MTLDHPIFTRWPAQYPDRLQLFSAPTPNGVKVAVFIIEPGPHVDFIPRDWPVRYP